MMREYWFDTHLKRLQDDFNCNEKISTSNKTKRVVIKNAHFLLKWKTCCISKLERLLNKHLTLETSVQTNISFIRIREYWKTVPIIKQLYFLFSLENGKLKNSDFKENCLNLQKPVLPFNPTTFSGQFLNLHFYSYFLTHFICFSRIVFWNCIEYWHQR